MLNLKKYKKFHRFSIKKKKVESSIFCPQTADYFIKIRNKSFLTSNHIETIRRSLKRTFKKNIFLKKNIFFNSPVTKKPISARMGKGKGKLYKTTSLIKGGRVLFEFKFLQIKNNDFGNKVDSKVLKLKLKSLNSKLSSKLKYNKLIY